MTAGEATFFDFASLTVLLAFVAFIFWVALKRTPDLPYVEEDEEEDDEEDQWNEDQL